MTVVGAESGGRTSWLDAVMTSAGVTSLAGMVAGLVWGGIGGRIAMRVLVLTSDDRLRGVTSDDGFEIGVISGATVFLLIFTAVAGAVAGFGIGLFRMVTAGPTWAVALGVAVATGAGLGANIVHSDGIDFQLLEPTWLAVGLFIAIPALWGLTVIALGQFLLRPGRLFPRLPERIDQRRWVSRGWIVLAGVTVIGVLDLLDDLDRIA